jgi:ferritin-like metal-binding protein YciE
MTTQPRDNLIAWLRDAYAMEGQAIELLERQIERREHYPEIRNKLQEHLGQPEASRQPSSKPSICSARPPPVSRQAR